MSHPVPGEVASVTRSREKKHRSAARPRREQEESRVKPHRFDRPTQSVDVFFQNLSFGAFPVTPLRVAGMGDVDQIRFPGDTVKNAIVGSVIGMMVALQGMAVFGAQEGIRIPSSLENRCELAAIGAFVYTAYYWIFSLPIGAFVGGLLGLITSALKRSPRRRRRNQRVNTTLGPRWRPLLQNRSPGKDW